MSGAFDLRGRVAVVTGGYGVLGGSLAEALAKAGARVAILGRNREAAEKRVQALREQGGEAMAVIASVLDDAELRRARDEVVAAWGGVDILVNAAGGNVARARTDHTPPFTMPFDAFDEVLRASGGPEEIVADLSSLRFLDVAGAASLVGIADRLPGTHRLVLHGVRPPLQRVLDRCGAPFSPRLDVVPRERPRSERRRVGAGEERVREGERG